MSTFPHHIQHDTMIEAPPIIPTFYMEELGEKFHPLAKAFPCWASAKQQGN